jgi:hypothetical protein
MLDAPDSVSVSSNESRIGIVLGLRGGTMARVSVEKTWLVQGPGTGLDAAIDGALHGHGMTASRSADKIEMRGGSQLKMRTMGGLFTKDSVLPRAGTLERSAEAGGTPGVERIVLST